MRRQTPIRRSAACLRPIVLAAVCALAPPALAQTTPADPAAAQPNLPGPAVAPQTKPGSPVVETIVHSEQPPLEVRKHVTRAQVAAHRHLGRRHLAYRHHRDRGDVERPALAGVELLAPLPPPSEPPHLVVPLPAYPLDSLAAAFLTPPPPIVCHRVAREPGLPDPRLYREETLGCEPDNP